MCKSVSVILNKLSFDYLHNTLTTVIPVYAFMQVLLLMIAKVYIAPQATKYAALWYNYNIPEDEEMVLQVAKFV